MLFSLVSCSAGSYGATSGAKIASDPAMTMIAMPSIAALLRRSR